MQQESRTPPPPPASISEEAQQILAMMSEFPAAAESPKHDADPEEWLAWSASLDEMIVSVFGARAPSDEHIAQTQFELNGVTTYVFTPNSVAQAASTPLCIDVHGGGLITGSGAACVALTKLNALERNMLTWAPDYRMPPIHPYPAALDDLIAVYRKALDERDPVDILVSGGSAGGNLAAALLLRAKDEGLPIPKALMLLTPEVDLTESGDSFQTNMGIDQVLGSLMEANLLYANGHDLTHPYISPLFGDHRGFPPTYLQTGTRDLFLSNTVLMHRRLRKAGIEAELHIGEAMSHGGFGGTSPEDLELAEEQARFIKRHFPSL